MEDLLRKQFEAQFGDEWSQPVVRHQDQEPQGSESGNNEPSVSASDSDEPENSDSEQEKLNEPNGPSDGASDGPTVVKHTESAAVFTQKNRRQFMSAKAPREPVAPPPPKTKEDQENLEDDLALQRLIQESHILDKQVQFSGADISYGDPMEQVGKTRLAIMQARLEQAGAKTKHQNTPMHIAKGIKAKQADSASKRRQYAKDAGIVLAKEKKVRKKRVHDKGLKINSVGKQTAHGIEVSARDIARVTKSGGKRKR